MTFVLATPSFRFCGMNGKRCLFVHMIVFVRSCSFSVRFACCHVTFTRLCFEGLVTCRSLPSRLLQVSLSSKLARSVCVLCVTFLVR